MFSGIDFFYITKTVYYEVSCGVLAGCVPKATATVDRGSDPAGALCELPADPTLG